MNIFKTQISNERQYKKISIATKMTMQTYNIQVTFN